MKNYNNDRFTPLDELVSQTLAGDVRRAPVRVAEGSSRPAPAYDGSFRGLALDSTEERQHWVFGCLLQGPDDPSIVTYAEDGSAVETLVYWESVGQFTGLMDVDGRDIYTLDVLQTAHGPFVVRRLVGPGGAFFALTTLDDPGRVALPWEATGGTYRVAGAIVDFGTGEDIVEDEDDAPEFFF